jgi:hypothetical protein
VNVRTMLVLLVAMALPAADLLPTAPSGVVELHGTFHGERFWARLNLPEARFNNHRMLELLYTPPKPEAVAGAHLVDCPFLLLDERLRLMAWNGRDSTQQVLPTKGGYRVVRELERPIAVGKDSAPDTAPDSDERDIAMPRGWDERLVPVMLALAWRAGSQGEVPIADLFGPPAAASSVAWQDGAVTVSGRPYRATADATGRLARLDDAAGTAVLTVTAWIKP